MRIIYVLYILQFRMLFDIITRIYRITNFHASGVATIVSE